MNFQKPADALTASGGSNSGANEVAQLGTPGQSPTADVPGMQLPPPPPLQSRYLPPDPSLAPPTFAVPPVSPTATAYLPPQDKLQPFGPDKPLGPGGLPQPKPGGSGDTLPSTARKIEIKEPPGGAAVTQLPGRDEVFRALSDIQLEKAIMEQLRRDLRQAGVYTPAQEEFLKFPPLPVLSPPSVPYQPKTVNYQPSRLNVEPLYVVHRKLYFEEPNGERAGWDLGPLSTLVATTHFFVETLLWPAHLMIGCQTGFWDTSAGKCLPGSPTPYYLYPPDLTLSGSVFEAGVITGFAFLFP
jgi:hypothetical protein